ncbi:OLC1v1006012C1 [Oldenlandia corymbosa var. corymbosa]|uniref:OLC1v1006012C1 n=1 Tax=Oldenlandia corymbosa var. corymbosa TaxID=529605 RepID=A0AAV1DGH5_OLDCO|nr:OLC1v1006012C1 [Oldenlandia corymbosa var. corymbosa]
MKFVEAKCSWCGIEDESDRHLVFECHWVKNIWKDELLDVKIYSKASGFLDWLWMKSYEQCRLEEIAAVLWLIWKSRYRGIRRDPRMITTLAKQIVEEFKLFNGKNEVVKEDHNLTWKTPP